MKFNVGVANFKFATLFLFLSLFSCIDAKYNLDDISGRKHLFENGIDFPLLYGDLPFSKMLKDRSDIKANEAGVYGIRSKKGNLTSKLGALSVIHIPQKSLGFNAARCIDVVIPGQHYNITFPPAVTVFTSRYNAESETLDDKISDIYSVVLNKEDDIEIFMELVGENDSPVAGLEIESITFTNYIVQLPSQLQVSSSVSTPIILNGKYPYKDFKISIPVKGIKDLSILNRKIKVDGDVKMNGGISLSVKRTSSITSFRLKLKPAVKAPAMEVGRIHGKADLKIASVDGTVTVGTMPAFLSDKDTKLILSNPALVMELDNQVNIPFTASAIIVPIYENGTNVLDAKDQPVVIEIPSIPIEGAGTLKKYIAREEIPEYNSKGYKFIQCNDLYKLGLKVPSAIRITLRGQNDKDADQNIDLGREYNTVFNYDVDIPFLLDGGSSFSYTEKEQGLNEKAFQYFSADEVFINSTFVNRYPAEVALALKLYDKEGKEMKGVNVHIPSKVKSSGTTAVTPDIIPAETYLKISLKENIAGDINRIDAIEWVLKPLFSNSVAITKYQNLSVKFVLEAPNGVEIIN